MLDSMLQNLKLYFPSIAESMVSYQESDNFEITVQCDDGSSFVYDDLDKTIRAIPADGGIGDESVWRREFGRRLRKRMIRNGLTQEDLANMVGISQSMLSNFMTGRSMPGLYIVDKLARALDCSVDDFIYNQG